jgi:hypothetical protein
MGAKTEQELSAGLEGGAEAAVRAAQEGHVYELTLVDVERHGTLRVRVRPTPNSVELDVAGEGLVLLATAVHNARRDGLEPSRLNLPKDHLANVQRIVEARIGVGPCVFVSASAASSSAVVTATRRIAEKLVQLKLASARTLVILHGRTNHVAMLGILGTGMYEGSDVFVSTIGRVMKPDSPEKSRKEVLRTLFEGGAWAVERDAGTWPTEIQIAVAPPTTLAVQTAREDAAAWLRAKARAAEARVSLLAVYDAGDAETMLRAEIEWRYLWDGLAVERALKDVRAAQGPLIFALHDGEAKLLRLALRALYDLGLMRDAAVLVLVADERTQQIQSTSLLYQLGDWHALRRREIGRGGRGGLRKPTKTSKDEGTVN